MNQGITEAKQEAQVAREMSLLEAAVAELCSVLEGISKQFQAVLREEPPGAPTENKIQPEERIVALASHLRSIRYRVDAGIATGNSIHRRCEL
jgi:hypothetical protein